MKAQQHRHVRNTWFTSLAGLCVAIALLAGCGGSSAPGVNARHTSTQQARPSPAQSNADVGSAHAQVSQPNAQVTPTHHGSGSSRRDRVRTSSDRTTGGHAIQRAHLTPDSSKDDSNSVGPVVVNPCTLVSVTVAETITGGPIAGRVEAPLGPTCIYKRGSSKTDITLAVESASFARVTRGMTKPVMVLVNGRKAYCGTLGTQMLFVPLPDGAVLNVTAPCAVARRFAATALSRLRA
jgi:hypothetical protein